jgi:hypothetical protein
MSNINKKKFKFFLMHIDLLIREKKDEIILLYFSSKVQLKDKYQDFKGHRF